MGSDGKVRFVGSKLRENKATGVRTMGERTQILTALNWCSFAVILTLGVWLIL